MSRLAIALSLLVLAAFLWVEPTRANGGTIRLAKGPAGPYELTVFTSPTPVRVGLVDVSLMVYRAGSDDLVQDARVMVTAQPLGPAGEARTFEATHDQATNKLYYAANVDLPTAGQWRIGLDVTGPLGEGTTRFEVEATQPGPLENAVVLATLAALPILLVLWFWWSGEKGTGQKSQTSGSH